MTGKAKDKDGNHRKEAQVNVDEAQIVCRSWTGQRKLDDDDAGEVGDSEQRHERREAEGVQRGQQRQRHNEHGGDADPELVGNED